MEKPCARSAGKGHGEPVSHDPIVTSSFEEGLLARQQEGQRICRAAVARRRRWLELVRPPYPLQGWGQGSEPLAPVLAPAAGAGDALLIARQAVAVAEGKTPVHPYLACQMSDFGFRQTLEVRTPGCAWRFRLLPTCTPPPR